MTLAQIVYPSLRTRQPSSSKRPSSSGDSQFSLREAARQGLGGVKLGEVLPNYFLGRIPLMRCAPVFHVNSGRPHKHEDSVIQHAIHE